MVVTMTTLTLRDIIIVRNVVKILREALKGNISNEQRINVILQLATANSFKTLVKAYTIT